MHDGDLKKGWVHIDARHVSGSHPHGAGDLFSAGTTRIQLSQAAAKVVVKGRRVTIDPERQIQTFEKKIVVNKQKALVRVVVDTKDNSVVTMFPAITGP
ncbi:hypothetical protein DBY65_020620 [Pseudomonas sp. RIT412]|nr:hypothetical protein DBY65_020620 [Pseudomonas sp. RIT 412]